MFELGDGLLGAYGVEAILARPDIRDALTAVVLSANDPVAAWGGVKLLRERFGIEPCAVTGPATDNAVGVEIIEEQMSVRAVNAMTSGAALGDHVIESLGLGGRGLAERRRNDARAFPAIVLGGTGYVAGELLRLSPRTRTSTLAAVASDSQPGEPVAQFFRHLQPVLPHLRFAGHDEVLETSRPIRVTRRVLGRAARRVGRR